MLSHDNGGATFLLEWKGFRALLPLGKGQDLPEKDQVQVLLLPEEMPDGEQSTARIAG